MRRNRRAKIVATIGPATSSPEMIRKMFLAGVDVFRMNFSHGTQDDHAAVHAAIRALERPKYRARSAFSRTSRARRSASAPSRTAASTSRPARQYALYPKARPAIVTRFRCLIRKYSPPPRPVTASSSMTADCF